MCAPLEQQQHRVSGAGIEACGGFVQEEDGRVDNQLHADVCPLPLSAGDPTNQLGPHLSTTYLLGPYIMFPVLSSSLVSSFWFFLPHFLLTLELATRVSPSNWISLSTFCSFSRWDMVDGRRSAAEKLKFSLTVRVPITTSSYRQQTSTTMWSKQFMLIDWILAGVTCL